MSFNKGYELKKFEAHWEKLRIEYAAAGMTEDAIQKMYDYDRQQFNAERAHLERMQELSTDTFECSEDENSPLMKRYREVTTVTDTYFERKRLSLKALTPRDLETFFRYERQQEEATVQQLLDWHRELTDALQYAVDSNWLKANPVKTVDPCLDNSPVRFNDFLMDWLKMMKSRVAITTYANYEIVITRRR